MLDKLAVLEEKYEELNKLIADPEIIAQQVTWQKHMKAHADLEDIVLAYRSYKTCSKELAETQAMAESSEIDAELLEIAAAEIEELKEKKEKLEQNLKVLLLPKDAKDDKNVILEVRAGTGGDEAGLFAGDLLKMYSRYAELKGWRTEILGGNFTDLGGIKEVVLLVEGRGAYSRLKFEGGVHRVQRVPETESSGRIHTSAATVAVMPEAQEVDLEINPNDVRIDIFCSSGPGGQSVNTTQSAVRLTHLPTGITVSCQDEKSQHKNKDKGMRILRARILEKIQEEQQDQEAKARQSMVGSGDRSQRIRTYNFPQGRITDHRIGLTLHKLDWVLQGNLDEIIDALITVEQTEKLKRVD